MQTKKSVNNIFKKVLFIFSSPKIFFRSIEKEEGLLTSFRHYLFVAAVGFLLTAFFYTQFYPILVYYFPAAFKVSIYSKMTAKSIFFFSIQGYLKGVVYLFLWTCILWVVTKLFRSKKTFSKAFQLIVYSQTPTFLFGWLPWIFVTFWIYDVYLLFIGISQGYKFGLLKSVLSIFLTLISGMILISLFIEFFYLAST